MDISTLTQLINALRAETREDSISPESLGALLQKIVDLLEEAADKETVRIHSEWIDAIRSLNSVLTGISNSTENNSNVALNIAKINPSNGQSTISTLTLKPVTTERAGVMTAAQLMTVNNLVAQVQEIINRLVVTERSSVMEMGSASLAVQQKGTGATASGERALAVNDGTRATGKASTAEGDYSLASGFAAHAEGSHTEASGTKAHAEGMESVASADNAHAEGRKTTASNTQAHAQGEETVASGVNSHAGGYQSKATGKRAFAHGYQCQAQSENGVALNCATITSNDSETAVGRFNKSTPGKSLFVVGGGASASNRRNIFEVQKDGNILIHLNNTDDVSLQQTIINVINNISSLSQSVNALDDSKLDGEAFDVFIDELEEYKLQVTEQLNATQMMRTAVFSFPMTSTQLTQAIDERDFNLVGGARGFIRQGMDNGGNFALCLTQEGSSMSVYVPACGCKLELTQDGSRRTYTIAFMHVDNEQPMLKTLYLMKVYFNGEVFDSASMTVKPIPEKIVYTASSSGLQLRSGNIDWAGEEQTFPNTITGFLPFYGLRAFVRRGTRCNIKISVYNSNKVFIGDKEIRSTAHPQAEYTYNDVWAADNGQQPAFFRLTFFESGAMQDVNADTWQIGFDPF